MGKIVYVLKVNYLKYQRIGNKEKINYNFVITEANTTYIVSLTESSPQDEKYMYDSNSYEISVDNHALNISRTIPRSLSFISLQF